MFNIIFFDRRNLTLALRRVHARRGVVAIVVAVRRRRRKRWRVVGAARANKDGGPALDKRPCRLVENDLVVVVVIVV
jgi:hypothetical protein